MSYRQGYFKPSRPEKYKGNANNIFYRSSWEKKMFSYCDQKNNILKWNSEEIVIPYISPMDGQWHRYFVDLWIQFRDKNGEVKEKIIEIKPSKETQQPKLPRSGRKTKRYLREAETYAKNSAKWKAAKEYADKRNMEFQVLTEYELGIK